MIYDIEYRYWICLLVLLFIIVLVELARVPVPIGSFPIFQRTIGARVLRTVLAVDIVVVGERYKAHTILVAFGG